MDKIQVPKRTRVKDDSEPLAPTPVQGKKQILSCSESSDNVVSKSSSTSSTSSKPNTHPPMVEKQEQSPDFGAVPRKKKQQKKPPAAHRANNDVNMSGKNPGRAPQAPKGKKKSRQGLSGIFQSGSTKTLVIAFTAGVIVSIVIMLAFMFVSGSTIASSNDISRKDVAILELASDVESLQSDAASKDAEIAELKKQVQQANGQQNGDASVSLDFELEGKDPQTGERFKVVRVGNQIEVTPLADGVEVIPQGNVGTNDGVLDEKGGYKGGFPSLFDTLADNWNKATAE